MEQKEVLEAASLDLHIHFWEVKPCKKVTNKKVRYRDAHWKGPVQVGTPGNYLQGSS